MNAPKLLAAFLVLFLAACGTTSTPITPTGNADEYIVSAKHYMSVFSSIEEAQKEAETRAMNYCIGIGKIYTKKYALDRPMAIGQVPESTLYFTCSDSRKPTSPTGAPSSDAGALEQAKSKCIDLGFKAGTESFGQCILKISK